MEIPSYQKFMHPIMDVLNEDKKLKRKELHTKVVIKKMELTESQCTVLLKSGTQTIVDNRFGWALTYLKKAGLIQSLGKTIRKSDWENQ